MSGIPKLIHQTFSTRDSLPRQLEENINYLQGLNPDWVHEFYDDDRCEKFITDNYPKEYLNRYQRISHRYGAARADYFRYLLMYKRGGVYLDIKSTVIFPLSDVIPKNTSYLLSRWDNHVAGRNPGAGIHTRYGVPNEYQQWFIVCQPMHPFLKHVIHAVNDKIDRYNPLFDGVGASGVYRTTGPVIYTLAIDALIDEKMAKCSHDFGTVDIYEYGFRYSCLKGDSHHNYVPSYKKIRYPVISPPRRATYWCIAIHVIALIFGFLHDVTCFFGIQKGTGKLFFK